MKPLATVDADVGHEDGPAVTEAIDRVVDAAQGLVGDEIALARVSLETTIAGAVAGGLLLAVGVCLGLGAWTAFVIAAYEAARTYLSPVASLVLIGVANTAAAGVFVAEGAARLRAPRGTAPAEDRR